MADDAAEDGAELRETVHELASRVESMQQTLERHQQHIDRMSASQAVFEREIAELLQDHRGVIADLRGQHRSTQQQMDMLLEALQEGLAGTEVGLQDTLTDLRDRIELGHDGGNSVLADEMDVIRDKLERLEERKTAAERLHTATEDGGEQLGRLADAVEETRERLDRLERLVDESRQRDGKAPTVIE